MTYAGIASKNRKTAKKYLPLQRRYTRVEKKEHKIINYTRIVGFNKIRKLIKDRTNKA